ncbi:NAD(P)H-binding protein [Mumia zhuanghuii]|uniref:NAD(P)H-binding protein n=2 Tax=Mumia TaxID=1546255 RepID=A0ABW1QK41_9ACTN|nr:MULTISPECIES: NAD(P)H-binding protein [Mumia]KAA1423415.1 NAD(P)H-binding protein [Mumia zhuanghuii]
MTTIAVTTPTGHVGSRVVRILVQAGVRPVLLLRDAGRLDPDLLPYVEPREGDLRDPDYVVAATEGVDALFWVDPTDLSVDDPNASTRALAEHAAAAVRQHAISRVVLQSSGGAELRQGAGLIDGLAAAEEILGATGTNLLALRCGYFFSNLLDDLDSLRAGVLMTAMTPDRRLPWVAPHDVAGVVAANLLAEAWSGLRIQGVHGPEDLSFADVARTITEVTGHPVAVHQIGDDELLEALTSLGIPEGAARQVVGMTTGVRELAREQARDVLTTTPTTLSAWA